MRPKKKRQKPNAAAIKARTPGTCPLPMLTTDLSEPP